MIDKLVIELEEQIWHIIRCTYMHVGSIGEAERLVYTYLTFRDRLLERTVDHTEWFNKNYKEIPGPERCIAEVVNKRYPIGEREFWFKFEMTAMLIELEGLEPPEKLKQELDKGPPVQPHLPPEVFERAAVWREVADFAEMISADPDEIFDVSMFIEKTGLGWEEWVKEKQHEQND